MFPASGVCRLWRINSVKKHLLAPVLSAGLIAKCSRRVPHSWTPQVSTTLLFIALFTVVLGRAAAARPLRFCGFPRPDAYTLGERCLAGDKCRVVRSVHNMCYVSCRRGRRGRIFPPPPPPPPPPRSFFLVLLTAAGRH